VHSCPIVRSFGSAMDGDGGGGASLGDDGGASRGLVGGVAGSEVGGVA